MIKRVTKTSVIEMLAEKINKDIQSCLTEKEYVKDIKYIETNKQEYLQGKDVTLSVTAHICIGEE